MLALGDAGAPQLGSLPLKPPWLLEPPHQATPSTAKVLIGPHDEIKMLVLITLMFIIY